MTINYQKQWQFLQKTARIQRVPHAFLFYGQDAREMKKLALEFIKLLNGQDFGEKIHPDLIVVKPEDNKEIKISQIRALHLHLSLRAYSAPFKAVIINEAHYLNQDAQSALLKLLEEPKGQTIFILITKHPDMLLPTILSRVERLRFYSTPMPCKDEEIKELLEVSRSDLYQRFQYAKKLSDKPEDINEVLEIWLRYFREVLISNPYQTKTVKIIKTIQNINFLLFTTNVNPRLAIETLMLEL